MKQYDIIVVGGGPAGLTAALYALRADKRVVILEKGSFGGQITYSPNVENIPGFTSLSGNEFAEKLVDQVLTQGGEMESCEVLSLRKDGDAFTVTTDDGDYTSSAVILAAGARHRLLGVPGEERYIGNGVSFCAVCDGAFYKGKKVGVVGGGNSALQEAILLSDLAKEVTVIQNLDVLTGEEKLQQQLAGKPNVSVITGTVVDGFLGEGDLTGIRIRKESDGSTSDLPLDGLFIAIGLIPQNEPFRDLIALDARGYAEADESCRTRTPGVFVAGDCRTKSIRQVTTACADGAVAALAACDYLDGKNS